MELYFPIMSHLIYSQEQKVVCLEGFLDCQEIHLYE
jgi:hypothetical protein